MSADEVTAEKGATPKRRTVAALADPGVVARVVAHRDRELAHAQRRRPPAPPRPALDYPVSHARRDAASPRCAGAASRDEDYTLILAGRRRQGALEGPGQAATARAPASSSRPAAAIRWSVDDARRRARRGAASRRFRPTAIGTRREVARGRAKLPAIACCTPSCCRSSARSRRPARPGRSSPASAPTCRSSPPSRAEPCAGGRL